MTTKTLVMSWTFWFGVLQVLLGIVGLISGNMDAQASITLITTGIGTIGFRVKTSQPISGFVRR